jgi:putative glutamine amidotransferase
MIAISMRMMQHIHPDGTGEVRDALAHDWWRFLCGVLSGIPFLPVPNIEARSIAFLQRLPITGIVLTGGDDWGVFPERDATEERLILWAKDMSLPIMGVCRGAQVLNQVMGGRTSSNFTKLHAGTRHMVQTRKCDHGPTWPAPSFEVNSYHNLGIRETDLAAELEPWAIAEDGSVEGFSRGGGKMMGIMWHPERERVTQQHDIHLFQQLFT